MTKHHWTPDAVHDLVKDWPDEARAAIGWAPGERQWVQLDGSQLSADLAAAAHVESGLERLIGSRVIEVVKTRRDHAVWSGGSRYSGPTLLHAVSDAIMAAGGGS